MALTLITGEPGTGKTRLLYDVIRCSAGEGVPVLLLPSAPDVARARRELIHDEGLAGVNIAQIDVFLATLYGPVKVEPSGAGLGNSNTQSSLKSWRMAALSCRLKAAWKARATRIPASTFSMRAGLIAAPFIWFSPEYP